MQTQHSSFEEVLARVMAKRNAEVTPRTVKPTETTLDEQVRIFGRVKARNEARRAEEVTPLTVRRRIRDLVFAYGLK
jgi:hypothetical protein